MVVRNPIDRRGFGSEDEKQRGRRLGAARVGAVDRNAVFLEQRRTPAKDQAVLRPAFAAASYFLSCVRMLSPMASSPAFSTAFFCTFTAMSKLPIS